MIEYLIFVSLITSCIYQNINHHEIAQLLPDYWGVNTSTVCKQLSSSLKNANVFIVLIGMTARDVARLLSTHWLLCGLTIYCLHCVLGRESCNRYTGINTHYDQWYQGDKINHNFPSHPGRFLLSAIVFMIVRMFLNLLKSPFQLILISLMETLNHLKLKLVVLWLLKTTQIIQDVKENWGYLQNLKGETLSLSK